MKLTDIQSGIILFYRIYLERLISYSDKNSEILNLYKSLLSMAEDISNENTLFQEIKQKILDLENENKDKKDPEVLWFLGFCYQFGIYLEADEKKGLEYYRQIENNHAFAQLNLGISYKFGAGVAKSILWAESYFLKAREHRFPDGKLHCPLASHFLGLLYADEINEKLDKRVLKDLKKIKEMLNFSQYYQEAVDANYGASQFQLGECYYFAKGGIQKPDIKMAVELFNQASVQGVAEAQHMLGEIYFHGHHPRGKNEAVGIELTLKAAKQGCASAKETLVELYEAGKIKEEFLSYDLLEFMIVLYEYQLKKENTLEIRKKINSIYEKLSIRNDREGEYQVALSYLNGLGRENNREKALCWLKSSAEKDYALAKLHLAKAYLYPTESSNKDYEKAFQLYTDLEDRDRELKPSELLEIKFQLGVCYFHGFGILKNFPTALKYFKEIIASNVAESDSKASYIKAKAQFYLGTHYEEESILERDHKQAFDLYLAAAKAGVGEAELKVGECYLSGSLGVKTNDSEGLTWLKKSAVRNLAKAQLNLGVAYYTRCSLKIDKSEENKSMAFKWLRLAEENHAQLRETDLAYLQFILARCYRFAVGVEKDLAMALKYCKKSISNNNDSAEVFYDMAEIYREETPFKDDKRAFECYEASESRVQHLEGICLKKVKFQLGLCYRDGIATSKNPELAVRYFKQSAGYNYVLALAAVADCYNDGVGVPIDIESAVEWYQRAYEQKIELPSFDQGRIAYRLGYYSRYGFGISKDPSKACEYLTESIKHNYTTAYLELGKSYLYGVGVQKDPKRAFELFQTAHEKAVINQESRAEVWYHLGYCHQFGFGTSINLPKAFNLYKDSADQGDSLALVMLGQFHQFGSVEPKDHFKAFRLYEVAAKKGNPDGQFLFASCYQTGIGTPKDIKSAALWYAKVSCETFNKSLQTSRMLDVQKQLALFCEQGSVLRQDHLRSLFFHQRVVTNQNAEPADKQASLDKIKSFYNRNVSSAVANIKIDSNRLSLLNQREESRKKVFEKLNKEQNNEMLAFCYLFGLGTVQNLEQALLHYGNVENNRSFWYFWELYLCRALVRSTRLASISTEDLKFCREDFGSFYKKLNNFFCSANRQETGVTLQRTEKTKITETDRQGIGLLLGHLYQYGGAHFNINLVKGAEIYVNGFLPKGQSIPSSGVNNSRVARKTETILVSTASASTATTVYSVSEGKEAKDKIPAEQYLVNVEHYSTLLKFRDELRNNILEIENLDLEDKSEADIKGKNGSLLSKDDRRQESILHPDILSLVFEYCIDEEVFEDLITPRKTASAQLGY